MRLFAAFDIGRIILAVALALVLYLFAVSETNPEATQLVDFAVPVEVVNVPAGLVRSDQRPEVRVRVRAPLDVFNRLRPESFVLQADASEATPGQVDLFVNARSVDTDVREVIPVPARVQVGFEEVQERTVPVRVNVLGQVPPGYQTGAPTADPARVTVSGPASLVRQAAEAVVDVNVRGVTVSVNGTFTPRVIDPRGNELRDLSLRPAAVNVQVPITQQAQFKEVGVRPNVQGRPAPGYFLEPIEVEPPTATLVGEPSALEAVNFVETAPIDVTGLTSTAVRRVGLVAPPNTALLQPGQTVLVTIRVAPLNITQTLRVVPQVLNTPPGTVLAEAPEPVEVVVSGPAPTLSSLTARDFRVAVDLAGRPPGTHLVDAVLQNLPTGMTVERIEPSRVQVELREAPPTPSPIPTATSVAVAP